MVIVVSGASRGLGYSLTELLLLKGHTVIALCRASRTNEKLFSLSELYSERLRIYDVDVCDENSIQHCVEYVKNEFVAVDVLINNAAVYLGHDEGIRHIDITKVAESIDVNTIGAMRVTKSFIDLLHNGTKKLVLNISSEAGSITTCGQSGYGYSLSKIALNMFSQILSNELANDGFTVLSIHPGRMRTDMGRPNFPDSAEEAAEDIHSLMNWDGHRELGVHFIDRHGKPMPL